MFDISRNGTYVVRFHFFYFSSLGNLSDAHFNISAYESPILSNFTIKNSSSSDFLPTQEFFLPVHVGKLRIDFMPFDEHSFAFANAIEYNGLVRSPLHVIHRINVGGSEITPDNDTLLRYWIPADDYLLHKNTVRSTSYEGKLNYQRGGATQFNAPDSFYRTLKTTNIVNTSWHFDIHEIRPFIYSQTAAPFYEDFVVDSDDFSLMLFRVRCDQTAFLDGIEILEVIDQFAPRGSHSNRMKLFIIIGRCVGVVLVLIVLAMFMFCLKRRKWMLVETRLALMYKGALRNCAKVTVKRSEPGDGQGLPEFQREIMILSKIRHQNLIPLIGYCDECNEMILVYKFIEKGTLRDHLYSLKGESEEFSLGSKLSWDQSLRICIGAARGLDYFHTGSPRAIIHRDIKSTNILLDKHYVAKTHVTTDVKDSFRYLDPEYFRCFQLTLNPDVYSFVLLEVLCARPVIDHSLPREQLDKIVDPLLVGKINIKCLRKYGETIERCLQEYGVEQNE
ncbi:Serine/threonine protein kinase [Handroanthus impetiginosus]|uniref:Serine/threonine protein kinase n=1 Tax=Handroanthus impetiginosus TaxID=429701 RepID=A0A2G9G0L1_9LAMI|nr:Serine/threonine protein kinase [Handroanthus impetiginosus]